MRADEEDEPAVLADAVRGRGRKRAYMDDERDAPPPTKASSVHSRLGVLDTVPWSQLAFHDEETLTVTRAANSDRRQTTGGFLRRRDDELVAMSAAVDLDAPLVDDSEAGSEWHIHSIAFGMSHRVHFRQRQIAHPNSGACGRWRHDWREVAAAGRREANAGHD